jgi:hypothetical protein
LVIINLFGAYAQDYDAGKPGELLSVFTDTVELTYMNGGKVGPDWVRDPGPGSGSTTWDTTSGPETAPSVGGAREGAPA